MKKKKIFQMDTAEEKALSDAAWVARQSQAEFIRQAIRERIEREMENAE